MFGRTAVSGALNKKWEIVFSSPHTPLRSPSRPAPPLRAVRFGDLPKEERKAVNKVVNRQVMKGFDHTHICNKEIGGMLACFESHNWETAPCLPQIESMYACVETHKDDPDPKQLVGKWQKQMKRSVLTHFTKAKIAARR